MKLLLLQPPVRDFYDTTIRLQPLGPCSLKAYVSAHLPDMDVEVRDYHHGWGRRTVPIPAELHYLREYYPAADKSPFCSFFNYFHFGAPFEDLAADVAKAQPDVVGISSLFSAYHREVLACAEAIAQLTDATIVVGGSHASAAPESILTSPAVDFVVRGEGEEPLVRLLEALRDGKSPEAVPNLVFRRGGELVYTELGSPPAANELPAPDFSDLPLDKYRMGRRPMASLVTSRGCPHRCTFCSIHTTFGHTYRKRPLEHVLAEIDQRYSEGYRAFDFEDDNLTLSRGEMRALCEALIERYPPGELELLAMNGVSYLSLDTQLLALMKNAGFGHLNLALVSLDREMCRKVGRPSSPKRFREVVDAAFDLGFQIVGYAILGLPGETLESMFASLSALAELPLLIGASPFYLPPDSPIAPSDKTWTSSDLVRCRTTALGSESTPDERDQLYTLFVASRIINFVKGLDTGGQNVLIRDLLDEQRHRDERGALGARLLLDLLDGGALRAVTRTSEVVLERFRRRSFDELWAGLEGIRALDGGWVRT